MKKILFIYYIAIFSFIAVPVLAAATFSELVNNTVNSLLKPLPAILVGIAVVMFIYGVIILMFSEGGEKKEEGKQYMIWGIVGIFVIVTMWGLINILAGIFNLDNNVPPIKIKPLTSATLDAKNHLPLF
jgi:hypothetical protein